MQRLHESRERSRQQLVDIRAHVALRRPEMAWLFDAQLLMLDDPMLVPRAGEIVRGQGVNAEWAIQQVFHEIGAVFDDVADPYLRERKGDAADLVGRLKMNLRQGIATPRDLLRELDESSIIIADELTPSLAAQVDWTKIRGFATDAGSRTYHTAILARSLEVPAVVGLHNAPVTATIILRRRPRRPNDAARPRPLTACGFESTPISSFPTTSLPHDMRAPRGSGCTGPSFF
jgi:phosphotransferase system enzyme I (PtsI)